MGRLVWIAFVALSAGSTCLRAEPPPVQHFTLSVGLPDGKLLPAGAALCTALGVKPGAPCDDDVILERSQYSTDKRLWIEKTVAGLASDPLGDCFQPIAVMTYGKEGAIHVCHVPDEDDTVTALDIQRLQDVAARLNADPDKTLAKHQWIMSFKSLWQRVN